MNLDELAELATGLIDSYADRNTLYQNVDKMFYFDWQFPDGMPDWVIKTVSTDPRDAVMTTVKTFATLAPRFKVLPMLANEANRNRANQVETALCYNFKQAGRRNDATVVWDVMWSATQYAEVAAQVIYLPYQEKILEAMGKSTKRVHAAKRFGDFAFILHNPGNIYPVWSEYGLEGVLTVRVQTVDEFMASWGKLANKVVTEKEYNDGKVSYVTSCDYIDYDRRYVWGVYSDSANVNLAGNGIKILDEENKLGFIPYAIKRWGNSLSADSNKRVMPLLQSIYDSGQWDMLNVFESLDASLTMKRAAAVRFAGEFPPGQEPEVDNTEPEGVLKLPAGTRNFTPLPGQSVDQRLTAEKTQFKSGIWQSTVARALQTLEFPSGTAYSSVNQILSTATNSLSPYKILGQNALAEIAHLMLCWTKYYGKEYDKGTNLYGKYENKLNVGKNVSIPWDEINPDELEIEVILTADMPIDKLQTINGAVLMKQNFNIPESELIEDLGFGDPVELNKRRKLEDYQNTYVQADLKRIAMQPDLEAKAGIQQQAAQQEQQARQQEAQQASAQQNGSPAMDNAQGMMNNPAMGGNPPVTMARGQG